MSAQLKLLRKSDLNEVHEVDEEWLKLGISQGNKIDL